MGNTQFIDSWFRYFWNRFTLNKLYFAPGFFIDSTHSLQKYPSVTILIPTRDRLDLLKRCVESLLAVTKYPRLTVVVINNDSIEDTTLRYFQELKTRGIAVIDCPGNFNFSKIMNTGSAKVNSGLICSLNNDTVVTDSDWLKRLVSHFGDSDVGIVGPVLQFPNQTIQHAGIAIQYRGLAGHVYTGQNVEDLLRDTSNRCFEVSGVTFACAVTSVDIWRKLDGLDENLRVGLNDVDYCLRLSSIGKKSVVCVGTCVTHLESASRQRMTTVLGAYGALRDISKFFKKYNLSELKEKYFILR